MRWLVLAVLACATTARADQPGFDPKTVYKIPRGTAYAEGPADAPITIVEWSDYACGYCNRVQTTLDHLNRLYPGQIRWVHRTLLLDEDYTLAAEASLAAAAQGKFRPMHDRLFALHGRITRAEAELVARQLGLDMIRFRADLDAGTYRDQVRADGADAEKLGVSGTPAFFINGRPVNGNQPLKVFVDTVDEELARAKQVAAGRPADLYEALVADGKPSADATDAEHDSGELDPAQAYRVGLGLPGHQLGPDDALVTIVEWSDFACPYCQRQTAVLQHVRQKYGDQVRIVYRHFPLFIHRHAQLAAEAGVAAAEQGKFWAFHDEVWKHFGKLTRADLEEYAQAAGLDMAKFRAALDERRYRDTVVAELAAAEALGVSATPTMFINGQPIVGSRRADDLDRAIDAHLQNAKAAIARGLPKRDIYALVMSMAQGAERADPSAIPDSTAVRIEMRPEDRGRAVEAACRRRDVARAEALAGSLEGAIRKRAATVCAGEGIDLP
ncbi:MAG TPA: thioredoxin domain-containing protein [Kofleriaceae bacterium]|nr:thioredoxin domain-containing protein [Kofleriaceae bacterium]